MNRHIQQLTLHSSVTGFMEGRPDQRDLSRPATHLFDQLLTRREARLKKVVCPKGDTFRHTT